MISPWDIWRCSTSTQERPLQKTSNPILMLGVFVPCPLCGSPNHQLASTLPLHFNPSVLAFGSPQLQSSSPTNRPSSVSGAVTLAFPPESRFVSATQLWLCALFLGYCGYTRTSPRKWLSPDGDCPVLQEFPWQCLAWAAFAQRHSHSQLPPGRRSA